MWKTNAVLLRTDYKYWDDKILHGLWSGDLQINNKIKIFCFIFFAFYATVLCSIACEKQIML